MSHTLRQIIDRLERADPDHVVAIGWDNWHSYRGYYDQLEFSVAYDVTVATMLGVARSALGQTMEGYKGGEYIVSWCTECWLGVYGSCRGQSIGQYLLDYMLATEGK